MHSLFQLNLASPAKPSMSILFPPALASSEIFPVEQPWACALTCNLWCVQRSLCGLRLRFHPLSGLAAIAPVLTGCPLRQPVLAINFRLAPAASSSSLSATNSDALSSHQLNETLRPINLWKQVQKSS